ncbi:MAG: peptidylprolyl isomerase [Kofleriaceae bacterium]
MKRAAGLAELKRYATDSDVHTRELALRGLGRIGGDEAMRVLLAAVKDPQTASAAYAAIGVAASLDDTAPLAHQPIDLEKQATRPARAIVEAFGRAAAAEDQVSVINAVKTREPELWAEAALALGRMARRKLAFSPEALAWLIQVSSAPDRDTRYAATYALSREWKPADPTAAIAALVARLTDEDPETRATALAGLAKRGVQPNTTGGALEDSLRDTDWRVAVEAVRALAGDKATDVGREFVATNLVRRWEQLRKGSGGDAQVLIESLHLLLAHPPTSPTAIAAVANLVHAVDHPATLPEHEIAVLARLVAAAQTNAISVDNFATTQMPRHVLFAITTQAFAHEPPNVQAQLLRQMAESSDPKDKATGLGLLADPDNKALAADLVIAQLKAAIASKDEVISGAGADAIGSYFEAHGVEPTLQAAVIARASIEDEPELESGLLETIGKYKIADGAAACRRALTKHPIVARAGAACLKNLGEAVPVPPIGDGVAPPVDVATVIGKQITWHLTTTGGDIAIELRPDISPWAVATIVALTQKHFYDGLEFHRVVPDFVVQGGDPTMSGVGGPGYVTPAEPATSLDAPGYIAGGIGIADAGRDSGGSQWFAMHSRAPHLDGRYTYIGRISVGQNIADSLVIGSAVTRATVEIR